VVNTERAKRRGFLMLATAAIAIACGTTDAHMSCSPTPTCSLRDARFTPPAIVDAGPRECNTSRKRCAVSRISAGDMHSCAIAAAGDLFCWGDDSQQQLGQNLPDASTNDAAIVDAGPDITRFTRVLDQTTDVAAGGAHSCAMREDGAVLCWGRAAEGQVDGTARQQPATAPRKVDVQGATQITAGAAHSCAVVPAGVVCWGSARYGQSGRELRDAALPPGLVPDTSGAVEVAAGVRHTCARLDTGRVLCWGELIDAATSEARPTPVATPVAGLEDAVAITAGAGHSCALRADRTVVCWGANDSGQLGNGSTDASATPVSVTDLPIALAVAAGGGERDGHLAGHSCATDMSFHVMCWGRNLEGQLGTGKTERAQEAVPVSVLGRPDQEDPYLTDIVALDLGAFHSCALDHDGPVVCWGDDTVDQLGRSERDDLVFGRAVRVARFGRSR
jgi:alpha-tubulin suppressor-like RCC1 family protein